MVPLPQTIIRISRICLTLRVVARRDCVTFFVVARRQDSSAKVNDDELSDDLDT